VPRKAIDILQSCSSMLLFQIVKHSGLRKNIFAKETTKIFSKNLIKDENQQKDEVSILPFCS